MARRRKSKTRVVTRYRSAPKRKSYRRKKGIGDIGGIMIGGAAYGAARAPLQNMLAPIMSKVPGGNYADNIAMGILDYVVMKNTSGMIRNAAKYGLAIEAAMVGGEITAGIGMSSNGGGNW